MTHIKSLLVFLNEAEKIPKHSEKANYFGSERGPFRCDHCEYYHPNSSMSSTGECEKVKGEIEGAACCNLFNNK